MLVVVGAVACGPLALDLGGESRSQSADGGTGGLESSGPGLTSTGGAGTASFDGTAGAAGKGGEGGGVGIAGLPDSCPIGVAVGEDCSDYRVEANCKLGDTLYHCERTLWTILVGPFDLDAQDLDCPIGIGEGVSCVGYSTGARCCVSAGGCFECGGDGPRWSLSAG